MQNINPPTEERKMKKQYQEAVAKLRTLYAKKLLAYREKEGKSIEEIAQATGISVETIQDMESGREAYSIDDLLIYATAIGCTAFILNNTEDRDLLFSIALKQK